jgi:flagellar basal-body rod protein FlgG
MIRALYTASTGMRAQETNIDVISNNLANVNTTGFKRSRAEFQDLMYQTVLEPGAPTSTATNSPTGIQVGLGVRNVGVQKLFQQGDMTNTNNQLDVAIQGDGFFEVTRPDGSLAYTRAGNFRLNEQGAIVTPEGYAVSPGLNVPQNAQGVTIGLDGTVSIKVPGQTALNQIGQLQAARFQNNAGLRALGQNLFEPSVASGDALTGTWGQDGFGSTNQGFLETSNVSVVEQVVSMITAQRAYEAASKGISTADEMTSQAMNLKR